MKKFLLFGAAAMMACAANAQIANVWSHSMVEAGANVRNCAAWGDKIVVANMGNGLVEVYDATGLTAQTFNVNEFLATSQVGTTGEDDVFSAWTIGRGIAVDGADNIVVNVNFPNAPSSTNFVAINPTDGSMMHVACEVPSPGTAARADFFGVTGDIFSNAFIGLTPNQATSAAIYNVYEGEQDPDYSYLVNVDEGTGLTNETKVFWAKKTLAEDAENAPEFYVYNRSVGGVRYSDGKADMVNLGENFAQGKASSSGATAFEVGGVSYVVMPTPAADGTRQVDFKVVNVATGEIVATSEGAIAMGANYAQDFCASVNEDGTVNIAHLVQGKSLSMYKLTLGASAIENIAADNAAVEYYNLQGVKVANPENGLFIKKQAGKATKVVL